MVLNQYHHNFQQNKDEDEVNMSITKTTIIKADLCSLSEASHISVNIDSPVVENKSSKDIPSPKRAFTVFQVRIQCYVVTDKLTF